MVKSMSSIGIYGFELPRVINFVQFAPNINLGSRVRLGRDDTHFVSYSGEEISTTQISNLSTGISLGHSNFEFGLELPVEAGLVNLMVSSMQPGTEIRLCNSPDPLDLVGDGRMDILRIPVEFQAYEIVSALIKCNGVRNLLIEKGCDLIPYGKGDLLWDHQFRFGQIFAPPIFAGLPSDAATTVRYGDCLRWQQCIKE